jgi:8-oxo-dGTP pyrophosphatase MutT (NUDIX family)
MGWGSSAAVTFADAVDRLQVALQQPLPGAGAHGFMAPRPRRSWPDSFDGSRVRHAAGLLLVFPVETDAHIILTVRADGLGRHGGQVSLPGGVAEPGETFEQAALREAHEEVGLEPHAVQVLGPLTPIDIPVSGFRLHPIVGSARRRPALVPADGEVARILDVALDDLLDSANRTSSRRVRDGQEIAVPCFRVADAEIWGATAMVLAEFLALVGWQPETD